MPKHAVFEGLVFDENNSPTEVVYIGEEPCYVVNDQGFRRHVPSTQVDSQVLEAIAKSIEGHEDLLSEQTAKMMGSEDPFSVALIESQIKNVSRQFDQIMEVGINEDLRAYLGMMGFRIRINVHGELIELFQPGMIADDDE